VYNHAFVCLEGKGSVRWGGGTHLQPVFKLNTNRHLECLFPFLDVADGFFKTFY